ncbi:MAG: ATP-binding protein [Carbonactinosporaceae bacterium]
MTTAAGLGGYPESVPETPSTQLLELSGGWHGGAVPHEASCPLGADEESAKTARDFSRTTLRRWGIPGLSADVGLVVSELVTNALRHGVRSKHGHPVPPIQLRLMRRVPNLVLCAVADPSTAAPVRRDPEYAAETGRGLQVIESCCHQWGWSLLERGGKIVWAAFTVGGGSHL